MLQVSKLTKSFGGRTLFEDISFSLGKSETVGLVGRNGCGKSTLFKMILGQEGYDTGTLSTPKGYRVGYLNQHIHFEKDTVLEEACMALSEEEQWDFYKAEKILFGLGFNQETIYQDPRELSGGYQLRVNLTKCLLENPDLLLLDEPTNYLDLPSLRWMQRFLRELKSEVIIITHDRHFMDSVSTHTMGIHRGRLLKVEGSTEKYYEQLALNEEVYERSRSKQERKKKHMQDFVDRFRAKASKATQAQSKLKQISKMEEMSELGQEGDIKLRFKYKPTPAKTLMNIKGLSFGFEADAPLFEDISFDLKPGERVAVIGKNGKGKTTLLNVVSGALEANAGEINFHPASEIGYYQQTNRKDLAPNSTVAEEIANYNPELTISQTRAICGAMMFSGDDADKKIKVLSGGEQGRVLLGKILARPANILLLDEPTNHLDMYSIDIMMEEIESFPGGVVVVTHSEEILRRLANKFVIFNRGKAQVFLGSYDEFLEKVGWEDEDDLRGASSKKKDSSSDFQDSKKRARKMRKLEKKIAELEKGIMDQEALLEEKNQEAIDLTQKEGSQEHIANLFKEIGDLQKNIEEDFAQLDELSKLLSTFED